MRKELKELLETIKTLSNKEDWEKNINTLSVVANLLIENYNEHLDNAVLRRDIFHGKLRVVVDFRAVQPTPEEVTKCQKKRLHR